MIVQNISGQKFLFLIICLVVLCGLFLPFSVTNLWWHEALNSAHTILFFFLSIALYYFFSARFFSSNTLVIYFAVMVVGMAIGVTIELLQGLFQREASVDDLSRDFFGMMSGLGFVVLTQQKISRNKILAVIFTFSFLLMGTAPLFQMSWSYFQQNKNFPSITAFEKKWFDRFLRFNHTELLGAAPATNNGEKFHRIRFDSGKYSGIGIVEPENNWSAYQKLRFQVFSDNAENINLVLKIYDKKHNQNYNDRFNQNIFIRPGLNEVAVDLIQIRNAPTSRKLDLANIAGIQLFLINVETSLFLDLSNLLLEK